nr:cell wall-binding repeat-containing protein [Euzebyaceae bacterium]
MSVTTRRVPVHSWLLAVTAGLLLAVPGPAHGAPTGGGPTGAGPIEITAPGPDTPAHLDGDPATTERLDERDVTAAAVAASQRRFAAAGEDGRHAAHVVVGRDDHFADSHAGTALTGDGPLLYTARTALTDATGGEIDRLLGPSGGRVYLLGGTAAIDQGVAGALAVDGRDVV